MLNALWLLVVAAGAPAGDVVYAVDPGASELRYHVVHKLHEVEAESRAVETKALLAPDGSLQVMARAPVASFKSGDANRDEHMLEVMDAGAHPWVVFKGAGRVAVPPALPATVSAVLAGELDFHGVREPEQVPVTVVFAPDGTAHVTGTFRVSLDRYKVDRPSLLFVKIDDACTVGVDLTMRRVDR